jgi:tetratricopeptide (TPR) repeat protein
VSGVVSGAARSGAERVDALAFEAMAAAEQGRFLDARRLGDQALRLARRLDGGRDRDQALARALRSLGTAQRAFGDFREAAETFQRALRHANASFGRASVEAAELHNDLGMTFKYAGRFADAKDAYGQAQTILESLPDADPEDMAALYHNLGGLAHARRDYAAAEPWARRAIAIRSAVLGPKAPATLLDRSAHAAVLAGLGRSDEAEASLRELLPELETALGQDHPEVAVALNNLAAIVQHRGALTEAEDLYRRVIDIKVARFGPDSPALAVARNNLGTVLRSTGRTAEAELEYQRALRLLDGAVADDHPNVAAIRRNLGNVRTREDALLARGRDS